MPARRGGVNDSGAEIETESVRTAVRQSVLGPFGAGAFGPGHLAPSAGVPALGHQRSGQPGALGLSHRKASGHIARSLRAERWPRNPRSLAETIPRKTNSMS